MQSKTAPQAGTETTFYQIWVQHNPEESWYPLHGVEYSLEEFGRALKAASYYKSRTWPKFHDVKLVRVRLSIDSVL
jgi:hypothetical protein